MDYETFEGTTINLRKLRESDAEITLAWRNSERARYLNTGSETVEQQSNWIKNRPVNEFNYMIELKDGTPVGMISLINVDMANRNAETSRFLIGEEEAVKGVPAAVEAMKLLYELAFDELDLIRIYGTVASNNKLMIKWQKYLGMKEEGRLRNHYYNQDTWNDGICLGLLVDEYRSKSISRMNMLINTATKN